MLGSEREVAIVIVQCECVREDRQEGRHEDRQGYRPDRRAGRGAGLA